jgi:hypothetical protein
MYTPDNLAFPDSFLYIRKAKYFIHEIATLTLYKFKIYLFNSLHEFDQIHIALKPNPKGIIKRLIGTNLKKASQHFYFFVTLRQ